MTNSCKKTIHAVVGCAAKLPVLSANLRQRTVGFAFAAAAAFTAAAVALPAHAALVGDYTNRKVLEVYAYEDFGGGDFVFRVDLPVAGCEGGFWFRPSDPGFKSSVATVLLAYSSKAAVRVWAYSEQLWTGSSAPTCRVHAVGLA